MRSRTLFAALLLCTVLSAGQQEKDTLRGKIRLIERLQDARPAVDSKLLEFFNDSDPRIRARALLAYGSLQDTSRLYRLVAMLADPVPDVQWAAAFAIGQTASVMGVDGRRTWEYELIRLRLDALSSSPGRMTAGESPKDRMMQELGKFCTAEGLDDLIIRQGNAAPSQASIPLVMAIARGAIRGVITAEGTKYVLRFIKPADAVPWQVIYALQRIGDREEIRENLEYLVPVAKHKNPLVRMHLAVLWGKLRDARTSLDPLILLAEFDGDWRVRVNALRALSNLDIGTSDAAMQVFQRSFSDPNLHVSMTALASFGNVRPGPSGSPNPAKGPIELLTKIALNTGREYEWQVQGEAAQSLAKLRGKDVLERLPAPDVDNPFLRYQLILALGQTGNPRAFEKIVPWIRNGEALMYRASLEALQEVCTRNASNSELLDRTYTLVLDALAEDDMAIRTTAASILGDSLFRRGTSVGPLLDLLSGLMVPNDTEVLQEVIASLGKLKDVRSVGPLEARLQDPDRTVVTAAANALRSITGRDYSSSMRSTFEPLHADYDVDFLEALPETVSVRLETIRGDIVIDLYRNMAPFTVMTILKLASQRNLYNGLLFHRVVPNFVIQGGDPRGDGWGGPGFAIRSEFSPMTFDAGAVGIASSGKDTEGSQFFIMHSPAPHLDGRYTIFGKVISGMEVVNKIVLGDRIFGLRIADK